MIIDPAVRRLLQVVTLAATVGALTALLGLGGLAGAAGAVVVGLLGGITGARKAAAADRAILTSADPGPRLREAADSRARSVLARPRSEDWAVLVVLAAVGVACAVTAVVRGQLWLVVPAVVLLAVTPVLWRLDRRGLRAATRWLDSPPFDREEQR